MKTNFLKQLPLFAHLDAASLTTLAANLEQHVYVKSELVFREGQKAERMFMVVNGRVKIFKTSADGKEHILQIMSQYSIVAEVPMFEGDKYPASCMAMSDVILFALPRTKFITLIKRDPKIALGMLALQAKRLKGFTVDIEHLTLQNSEQKLATYLLNNAVPEEGSDKPAVAMSKLNMQELANYLGIAREHLSRIISKFGRKKIIARSAQKITLLNVAALKALYTQNSSSYG